MPQRGCTWWRCCGWSQLGPDLKIYLLCWIVRLCLQERCGGSCIGHVWVLERACGREDGRCGRGCWWLVLCLEVWRLWENGEDSGGFVCLVSVDVDIDSKLLLCQGPYEFRA
ncbi:hypothetical protein BDV96DRAFT_584687 [Lophiotrema nucula]|uniref:Uncharacterized protein n=1 Tax=Lophiotrema nucula TaxID=690887 RepID=A0A6A5YTK4_9PLEO|nr:hypothetical protein BDV96DRAFT_584687 [Lophiotrema nucula]